MSLFTPGEFYFHMRDSSEFRFYDKLHTVITSLLISLSFQIFFIISLHFWLPVHPYVNIKEICTLFTSKKYLAAGNHNRFLHSLHYYMANHRHLQSTVSTSRNGVQFWKDEWCLGNPFQRYFLDVAIFYPYHLIRELHKH